MNTGEALHQYLIDRKILAPDTEQKDWYRDNWVRVPIMGRRIPLFPIYKWFKDSLILHDIHHVLSNYDTSWRGELEIAAWELSSGGCGKYYLYWADRMVFTLVGLLLIPRKTLKAWKAGRSRTNIFDLAPSEAYAFDYEELYQRTLKKDL